MALQKETEQFLLLLLGLNTEQEKVKELYVNQIKQTEEFQLLGELDSFEFISKRAKDLKSRIQKINIEKENVSDIQTEYQKLMNGMNDFQHFRQNSIQRLKNDDYFIDLISKNDLLDLKKSNPALFKKVEIIKSSNTDNVAEAFRQYSRKNRDKEILEEYMELRTPELQKNDIKQEKQFLLGGATLGALLCMVLLRFFMPVSLYVELGIIGLSFILFFTGYVKRNTASSLRLYTIILLCTYITFFVGVSLIQELGSLPKSFDAESLRSLHLYVLSALFGALIGSKLGEIIHFIPFSVTTSFPRFFQYMERRMVFFLITFGLFGYIWTSSLFEGKTVYQNVSSTIVSFIDKMADKLEEVNLPREKSDEKIGKVQVTKDANVRTEPNLKEDSIYTQVDKGTVLEYLDTKKVGDITWYQVEYENRKLWISGKTVKVVK